MIVLILILLMAIGYVTFTHTDFEDTGFTIFGLGVLLLFVALCCFIGLRIDTATIPDQRESLQHTYEISREFSEFERATITVEIAEFNRSLAIYKYWNESWMFGIFIDSNVREVEPIR